MKKSITDAMIGHFTHEQVYNHLFKHCKEMYKLQHPTLSEDKLNRKANIYAVRNTTYIYNNQGKS